MMSLDLLPELYILNKNKCEICIQTKRCKKSFKSIERSTKLLDLIHNDICQLNSIMTHSGKRYFITFIDDFSKYCHIYQIRSKDEAFQRFVALKNEIKLKINSIWKSKSLDLIEVMNTSQMNFLLIVKIMVLFMKLLLLMLLTKMG